jgi:hypothetical protein
MLRRCIQGQNTLNRTNNTAFPGDVMFRDLIRAGAALGAVGSTADSYSAGNSETMQWNTTGGPNSYEVNGKQFIVVPIGGKDAGTEWVAFALKQ